MDFLALLDTVQKQTQKETISFAELKEELKKLAPPSEPKHETRCAMPLKGTKAEPNKQCSMKGTKLHDGKHYCSRHYTALTGTSKATTATTSAVATVATTGEKTLAQPIVPSSDFHVAVKEQCSYEIKGKNPRRCTSEGSNTDPSGKYYCNQHFKTIAKKTVAPSKGEQAVVKIFEKVLEKCDPIFDHSLGVAVDQNGLLYVGTYKNLGMSVIGRLSKGEIVALEAEDLAYCQQYQYPVVEEADRLEFVKLTPEERKAYTGPQ